MGAVGGGGKVKVGGILGVEIQRRDVTVGVSYGLHLDGGGAEVWNGRELAVKWGDGSKRHGENGGRDEVRVSCSSENGV